MKRLALLACLALSACTGGGDHKSPPCGTGTFVEWCIDSKNNCHCAIIETDDCTGKVITWTDTGGAACGNNPCNTPCP